MQSAELQVVEVGAIAWGLVDQVQEADVVGVTSRGVFLRLASGWIVFLSYEQYRGPLTMNLTGDIRFLRRIEPGMQFKFSSDTMQFSSPGVNISIKDARHWSALYPPPAALPSKVQEQLIEVIRLALAGYAGEPIKMLGLLARMAGIEPGEHKQNGTLEAMINASERGDRLGVLEVARGSLGVGGGLTPWGDDLNIGMYLTLNRWSDVLAGGLDLSNLNRALVRVAQARTTTLSANLIECATLGQADERLILALDGIMSGIPEPPECASALLSWGSSSGLAVLAGIALATGVVASPHIRAML